MLKQKLDIRTIVGCIAVLGSAFCFYLATVVVNWSKNSGVYIDPAFFVFFRFIAGFVFIALIMVLKRQTLKPKRYDLLVGRTLTNCVAVYFFFKAVDLTSVAEANILNMTYPLFIALFSWIYLKEQRDGPATMIVFIAFAGVWLILSPEKRGLNANSLWGLASGISAAVSIIYLNLSRKVHDTETTLFFLFGLGGVLIFVIFRNRIYMPDPGELKYLSLCSLFSVAGQYLITTGFRYVTAIEGGIISSSRIMIAAILGPVIASDPALSLTGWTGALLIFGGNIFLTLKKARTAHNRL